MDVSNMRHSGPRGSISKRKDGKVSRTKAEEEAKRRESVKVALREKLEHERRGLQVVERLLEDSVTEDFLIDCARLITSSNYKDTVEERSIAKLCGYPICSSKLHNVPRQQYKISTKTNKVYDITERKCFCSNFCHKASKFFEVQIAKTPLWLRKDERLADVKLMKEWERGSSGLEVRLAHQPVSEVDIENPTLDAPQPHTHSPTASQSDSSDAEQDFVSSVVPKKPQQPRVHWGKLPMQDEECDEEKVEPRSEDDTEPPKIAKHGKCSSAYETTLPEKDPSLESCVGVTMNLLNQCRLDNSQTEPLSPNMPSQNHSVQSALDRCQNLETNTTTHLNVTQVGMSKKGAAGLKGLLDHVKIEPGPLAVKLSLLKGLKCTLMEWRTEETFKFLYGPDYATAYTAGERGEEEQSEEEPLDEDDLEEAEAEETVGNSVQPFKGQTRPSAPAPDYTTLRKETELQDLRVQEFFRGEFVLPEEVQEGAETQDPKDNSMDPALPLVDSNAQLLIQKRIVVEKLCRSLRDIVGPLHLTMGDIINDIKNLVRTFRFTNINILHKSPEWTLIAIVLLSVLTEVSPTLRKSLGSPSSVEYLSALMEELRLHDQDLHSLVGLFRPHTS